MSPDHPLHHILVAHDLEPDADAALDYAVALAKPLGARITLLHAYEVPSMGAPEVLVMTTDWIAQIGRVAQETLGKIVDRVKDAGVPIAATVRHGAVWREVEAFAKEGAVDLVIVGTHGRKGLPRALLGSMAEKIVRTAPARCSSFGANEESKGRSPRRGFRPRSTVGGRALALPGRRKPSPARAHRGDDGSSV